MGTKRARKEAAVIRIALVVGASSGLGYHIARRLALDEIETYAAARSFGSGNQPPDGCAPIVMDVNDPASVQSAVDNLRKKTGRIDILVNCAARLTLGACEELSEDELRSVMETNFFGAVRVIRAVLPVMRAQGSGKIVQLTSLNGLLAIPFQGAYVASKHALEGFCEALAMEVSPFGISVTIVEPGDCSGGSDAYRLKAGASENASSPYHAPYAAAVSKIRNDESNGLSPGRVANAVLRAVNQKRPPARIRIARTDQRLAVILHDALPGRVFQRLIASHYAPRAFRAEKARKGGKT